MRVLLPLLAVLVSIVPLWAQAQVAAPGLPEADKQAIASYNLNEDVFNRLVAATKEARAQGIKPQQPPANAQVHNLDDLANQAVGSDPRIAPLIKKHGFTPREFLLANIALMNAALVVQSRSQPEMAQYIDQSKVNKANVSFYEAHQSQIAALQSSGGGQ
ncbi:hypothetical protein ASG87_17120 [Frateuria sp. Soil773]|nr:hypothetical protein ASG87_17120 [Frateuria sp. Soil773]